MIPSTPDTHPDAPPTNDVPRRDPIPEPVHAVLALFRDALCDVRFPDVDRAGLEALAELAREREREIERLEDALEQARAAGSEAVEALGEQAKRALAYARVFAAGRGELEAKLAAFGAAERRIDASAVTSGATRRRGRPRKEDASGAPLLAIEGATLEPAVAE